MLKELGKQIGLGERLMFAFLWLFAPATMFIYAVKGFVQGIEDLSPEELQEFIEGMKDV